MRGTSSVKDFMKSVRSMELTSDTKSSVSLPKIDKKRSFQEVDHTNFINSYKKSHNVKENLKH